MQRLTRWTTWLVGDQWGIDRHLFEIISQRRFLSFQVVLLTLIYDQVLLKSFVLLCRRRLAIGGGSASAGLTRIWDILALFLESGRKWRRAAHLYLQSTWPTVFEELEKKAEVQLEHKIEEATTEMMCFVWTWTSPAEKLRSPWADVQSDFVAAEPQVRCSSKQIWQETWRSTERQANVGMKRYMRSVKNLIWVKWHKLLRGPARLCVPMQAKFTRRV